MSQTESASLVVTQWSKLRFLAIAGGISWMGSTLTTFTVILRYKDVFGPTGVSAIMLAMVIPNIIAAPYGGLLADRISARVLLTSLMGVMGLGSLIMAFDPGFVVSLACLALTAFCGTPVGAAFTATLPEYATAEDLPRVNGLMSTGMSVGMMFGPSLAGLLVSGTGSYFWPFMIDAASFWILAAAVLFTGVDRKPQPHVEGEKTGMSEGVKVLWRNPLLRAFTSMVTVLILSISVLNIGEVFLVMNILHADAFVYGIVSATFALGSTIGSVAITAMKLPERRHIPMLLASSMALALIMLALAVAGHWAFVAVVWFVGGLANAANNAYGMGLIMNRTPDAVRGRVMAAINGLFSLANVISMGAGGVLLGIFGVREVFFAAGLVCVAVVVGFAPSILKASRAETATEALAEEAAESGTASAKPDTESASA
jgi:MFS family permease